jgi:hypothetical protein
MQGHGPVLDYCHYLGPVIFYHTKVEIGPGRRNMKRRSHWIQHAANPLHIYCRLIDCGIGLHFSRKLGMFYEKYVYHFLARNQGPEWNSTKRRSL